MKRVVSRADVNLPELKKSVLDNAKGTSQGIKASPATFDRVDRIVRAMEDYSPIEAPGDSRLIAGTWRVQFSNAPPPSNGQFGPFIGEYWR